MELDRVIHKYDVDPSSGIPTLREVKPIRTLMAKGKPTIHIQAGHYFYENGSEIPEEELKALGFDPEMKNGVPVHMDPAPEVMAILGESKSEALKEWAYDIKGGPRRGR